MIIRSIRYLISRLLFLLMGLGVSRYRKEVGKLWESNNEARSLKLDQLLARNRPLNSEGLEVTDLEILKLSPPLSKKQLGTNSLKRQRSSGLFRFGRHTAGTTGEPTHVALNRKELARMLGVRDYCFRHYGVKLGQREARLWGRPESGVKSQVKNFLMNRRVFHPVGPDAKGELAELLQWKPDYLYGYASLLLEAAKILEDLNLEFEPPKFVVCTAESILPAQKAYISQAFRAPVAEEYGSTEFDVIAFECVEGHRHLVNPWLIAEEGEGNGLISDVSRTTQHLIRYQLGDMFTIDDSECGILGSRSNLEDLHGRTIDIFFFFNYQDKIHIITISKIIDSYFNGGGDVFSFMMEQKKYSELELEIDTVPSIGVDGLKEFLEREINELTGKSASVNIRVNNLRVNNEKRNYFMQKLPGVH